MYITARDEDDKVVVNLVQASELMGLFVPVEAWLKLILPAIEDGPHYGHLIVLTGFIEGAPQQHIRPHLKEISTLLADKTFCQSRKVKYQRELTKCIKVIMKKCNNDDQEIGKDIFVIAITLIALKDKENDTIIDYTLLDDLYKCLGLNSSYELWHKYTKNVLDVVNKDPKMWTINTAERCMFDVVLLKSGKFNEKY
ncbi:uncharacterized protein LOC108744019 [Agrilus planipennis]|uniref:Uncharacterized protein LOC108744019 n=1 Tax=Agrilus planipennis TaxID=224129 RepID=A0A1W4XRS8_AGRPL|nr:uncharacterized protein LOC108744019 [Agrilus planipennis]